MKILSMSIDRSWTPVFAVPRVEKQPSKVLGRDIGFTGFNLDVSTPVIVNYYIVSFVNQQWAYKISGYRLKSFVGCL